MDIVKHGRVVAVVLSPRAFEASLGAGVKEAKGLEWSKNHMISPELARSAGMLNQPSTFDED